MQLATRAAGGFDDAIISTGPMLALTSLSDSHLDGLFSVCLTYLDKRALPADTDSSWPTFRIPVVAMVEMSTIFDKSLVSKRAFTSVVRWLNHFWPTFRKWMPILFERVIRNARVSMDHRLNTKSVLAALTFRYLTMPISVKLECVPELAFLFARLWMQEIAEPHLHYMHMHDLNLRSDHMHQLFALSSAGMLHSALGKMDKAESQIFGESLARDFGATNVATTALAHLRKKIPELEGEAFSQKFYICPDTNISIIGLLSSNLDIRRALITHGSIAAYIKALKTYLHGRVVTAD